VTSRARSRVGEAAGSAANPLGAGRSDGRQVPGTADIVGNFQYFINYI